MPILKTN